MSASESRQLQSSPSSLGPDFSTLCSSQFSAPPVQISRQRDESGSELGALVAMAAASALSPSPRWPAYLEALRDGLDLASTRDAAALRDALAAVASARASCASQLHREICDAGSLAGAAGEEALAGGGSSRDDADDREATARTPGVKRRGSARPASPGPSRVTRARVSFGLSEEARLDDARDDDDEDAPASTSEPSAPASARTGDAPSEGGSRGTPAPARRSTRSASKRGSARPLGRTSSGGGFEGAPRLVGSSPALRGSGTPSASYRALGSSQLRGAYSLDDAAEWEAAKRLAEEETERTPGEASRGWDARGDVRKPRGEESAPPVADPTRAAAADQTRAASAPPPAPLDAYRLACAFRARLANGVVRGVAAAEGSRAAGGGAAFVVLAASEIEGGGAAEGAREISDAATDALLWRFSSSDDDETAPEPHLVARARLASFASDDPSARLGARHVALAPGGAAILVASRFARDPSASPREKAFSSSSSLGLTVVPFTPLDRGTADRNRREKGRGARGERPSPENDRERRRRSSQTLRPLERTPLLSCDFAVARVATSVDGAAVAAVSADGDAHVWAAPPRGATWSDGERWPGGEAIHRANGSDGSDGSTLGPTVRISGVALPRLEYRGVGVRRATCDALAFSGDGAWLFASFDGRTVAAWTREASCDPGAGPWRLAGAEYRLDAKVRDVAFVSDPTADPGAEPASGAGAGAEKNVSVSAAALAATLVEPLDDESAGGEGAGGAGAQATKANCPRAYRPGVLSARGPPARRRASFALGGLPLRGVCAGGGGDDRTLNQLGALTRLAAVRVDFDAGTDAATLGASEADRPSAAETPTTKRVPLAAAAVGTRAGAVAVFDVATGEVLGLARDLAPGPDEREGGSEGGFEPGEGRSGSEGRSGGVRWLAATAFGCESNATKASKARGGGALVVAAAEDGRVAAYTFERTRTKEWIDRRRSGSTTSERE